MWEKREGVVLYYLLIIMITINKKEAPQWGRWESRATVALLILAFEPRVTKKQQKLWLKIKFNKMLLQGSFKCVLLVVILMLGCRREIRHFSTFKSTLFLSIKLVTEIWHLWGTLSFEYFVDSEPLNGVKFTMTRTQKKGTKCMIDMIQVSQAHKQVSGNFSQAILMKLCFEDISRI